MSSHGNTPSRENNDDEAFVRLPSDSSQDFSVGGRSSIKPGADAGWRTDLKFPEGDRYQQLSAPIPGGMGAVFKALDTRLDIDVAIKRIRPELAKDTELIKRFEREAKMQVRLKHQHLVSVKDYVSDSYGPYIVMDWIDGQSLASVIRNSGAMGWRDAAILISKVAMALQEAHENNIIHRDVKPGNILLDKKGEPYITDFGLACAESASVIGYMSEMNAIVGTHGFMSPEHRKNPKDVTYLTDMWSLGATLYQLLTTYGMMDYDPELVPEELRGAVTKALKLNPSDRFGTMKLFAQELILCVSNNGPKPAAVKSASPQGEDDIADIWRKSQERTDKLHAEAKSIAEQKQDYVVAVQIMEQIPQHVRKEKLYDELIRRRDRVVALDAKIRDGVAQLRIEGLREAINELLKLQPNRAEMKKLLDQLPSEPPPKPEAPNAPLQKIPSPPQISISAPITELSQPSDQPLPVSPLNKRQAKRARKQWVKYLRIAFAIMLLAGAIWGLQEYRTAARINQTKNNLRSIGIALDVYHDSYGLFPAGGIYSKKDEPYSSWMTSLLPYIDQRALHERIHSNEPWTTSQNQFACKTVIPEFLNPSIGTEQNIVNGFGAAHYAGNAQVLRKNIGLRRSAITDGMSNTLFAGGVSGSFRPWGDPENVRDPSNGIGASREQFGGAESSQDAAMFLFVDGSVVTAHGPSGKLIFS